MAFEFEFTGGVAKPTFHSSCKFMLFFVVGGHEVPFYQMRQDNLVVQLREKEKLFSSPHNVVKVFTGHHGFDEPKRFHSFYVQLADGPAPRITIRPFPELQDKVDFKFVAKGKFLSKNEALAVLAEDADSRVFLRRQVMLPLDTLRRMVTIDRSTMREGVRHVRLPIRQRIKT